MKCSDVMKRDILTAHRSDSVQAVAIKMVERGAAFVAVVDDEGRFVGGLTERSLVAQVVGSGRPSHTLKAGNLSHRFPTVGPDDEHTTAEGKMRDAKSVRAVVVDAEDHLLGAISLTSLAETAGSADAGNLLKELKRADI